MLHSKRRPVKFEGRLYKARPTRGPLNKDLTLDDLKVLMTKLKGVNVKYNHGDTESIGDKTVGTILEAYIDKDEHLCVAGQIASSEEIGEPLFERIRTELLTKELPMLSMYWNSAAENPGAEPDKRIAKPDTRWMKEVSLVSKGLFPEANIVAVAASDSTHTAWKVASSLLASSEVDSPTVNTKMMALPSEKYAPVLKSLGPMKEEDIARFNSDAEFRQDLMALAYVDLHKENSGFKKEKEQEKSQYVGAQLEEAEKIGLTFKTHWKEPEEADWHVKNMKGWASDYEDKTKWNNGKRLYSRFADLSTELLKVQGQNEELKKLTGAAKDAIEAKPAEVAVVASDARNPAKKTVPTAQSSYIDHLVAKLAQQNK